MGSLRCPKVSGDESIQAFKLLNDSASIPENLEMFKSSESIAISARIWEQDLYLFMSIPDHPVTVVKLPTDKQLITAIKEILEEHTQKIFYDAKSTLNMLHSAGIMVKGNIFDVMLANQVLNAGVKKTNSILKPDSDLNLQQVSDETSRLFDLKNILSEKLEKENLMNTATLEFDCTRSTFHMELNGFCLDIENVKSAKENFLATKNVLKQELITGIGDINYESTQQVKLALISKGIDVKDTKNQTLLPLSDKHPVLNSLINYREVSRKLNLAENLLSRVNPETGRIHPRYNQIGAPTGRFSCYEPNLQGIPHNEFRSFFIASPGHKLIIADYSQIELRIAARFSRDQRMLEAYKKRVDLHKLTASILTGKTMNQVTKEERQAAKAVNFGLIYAMGATGLMEYARNTYGVEMTIEAAELFRKRFFQFYNGISQWHGRVKQNMNSGIKETRTLGGRGRIMSGNIEFTKMLNSPVQGTSADITKKALQLLNERLNGTETIIVGCIHDEIILETPEHISEEIAPVLKDLMIEAGRYYLKSIPVEVEVTIVDNWLEKS